MRALVVIAAGLLTVALPAEARVFNINERSVGAFIRGTGYVPQLGQDAFAHADGGNTTWSDDAAAFAFSGEFGAQFNLGFFNLRLGLEALRPQEVVAVRKNTSGTKLYDVTSTIFAYSPTATLEFVYSNLGNVRFFAFGSVGYTIATLVNKYELTAAGDTLYNPGVSHSDKGEGFGLGWQGGLGVEMPFVDNTTFTLDFGYRDLVISNYTYTGDTTTLTQGSIGKGTTMKNIDGSKRKTDLGGLYVGLLIRFYIF